LDALQFTLLTTATATARRAMLAPSESAGPTLYFAADTFISSAEPDSSSGALPGLVVMQQEHGTSVTLVQINLDSIDDYAAHASLRLYSPAHVTPVNVMCHPLTSDAWQESSVTWRTQVTWSEAVSTQLVSEPGYYQWDLTDLVQLALARGDTLLSLALRTEQGRVVFASKEHGVLSYRPALVGQLQARSGTTLAESSEYMRDGPDLTSLVPRTELLVEGTSGTQSRAYLRLSIFNVPRTEVYRLRLFGAKVGAPGTCVTVRAYAAEDTHWLQGALAAQPQFGVQLATTVVSTSAVR
jgi:hypothetical protein